MDEKLVGGVITLSALHPVYTHNTCLHTHVHTTDVHPLFYPIPPQ